MPDAAPTRPAFKRVLLKLSGEAFGHAGKANGVNPQETVAIAGKLAAVAKTGVQLAVVVGGGNLLRGAAFAAGQTTIKPATADSMGMLATVMNGLALLDALESMGCEARLMSAVPMNSVCEPYISRRAVRHLEKGRVVILAGGTGNPFVTTDTAAALRGRELSAEVLLKATKVDGIYDSDPEKNPAAERYTKLTYQKVLADRLKVMDIGAFEMCQEAGLPILVFDFKADRAIERAVAGQPVGTLVAAE